MHDVTIAAHPGRHTATCAGCGWSHTCADLGDAQARAIEHELGAPDPEPDLEPPDDAPTPPPTASDHARRPPPPAPARQGPVDAATPPTKAEGVLPTERTRAPAGRAQQPDMTSVTDELTTVSNRLQRLQRQADALSDRRNELVLQLAAAGWSYGQIARVAGITRARAHQIAAANAQD